MNIRCARVEQFPLNVSHEQYTFSGRVWELYWGYWVHLPHTEMNEGGTSAVLWPASGGVADGGVRGHYTLHKDSLPSDPL